MTKKGLPKIGDKLELFNLSRSKDKKEEMILLSQMLDIINEDKYVISGPIRNRNIVPMYKKDLIEIGYYKENKGKYFFEAKVKKVINKQVYKLEIERTSDIKKIQQRDYFRLNYSMDVIKIHNMQEDSEEIKEECITEDISGGGIGVLCNFKHSSGDTVKIHIKSDLIDLIIVGTVIRVDKSKNREYNYTLGVEFLEISDEDRDKIVKFIFQQQRKLRKKGLM